MKIDLITDPSSFARLEPAWRALESSPGLLGLFNGYTWQFEWWRTLGGGRSLRIFVAREGDEVVGLLPLYEETRAGSRRLAFIGSPGGGSDYLDALCRDDTIRSELLGQAISFGADLLDLEDVHSASPLVAMAIGPGRVAEVVPRYPCPFISIQGPFADFEATVPRRDTLKRRRKWFAGQPGFRIDCETTPESVAPFLDRFFRLHAARWRVDGGSQAFADPRLVALHRSVTTRLAEEGRARMWTLQVAGEAIAVAYSFEDRGRSLYYQSGYLPAWGSRSAGLVLFARYVEDAFERGCTEVDLLRGNEPYKSEWTKESRSTVAVRVALTERGRRTLRWNRVRARTRDSLKSILPESART